MSIEYGGDAIRAFSMEERMTICNMSIEWGARAGMIAPDETTFAYVEGRAARPSGADWDAASRTGTRSLATRTRPTTPMSWSTSEASCRR